MLWTPTLGRVYHLRPSDLNDLTPQQYRDIADDLRALGAAMKRS